MSDRGFPPTQSGFRTKEVGGKTQTGRFDIQEIKISVDRLSKNPQRFVDATLKDLQQMYLEAIVPASPRDTGDYAKGWHLGPIRGNRAAIYNKYGELFAWLEFTGTRRHKIRAKGKAAGGADHLKIEIRNGVFIFPVEVDHPGTEPEPHARPTMRTLMQNAFIIVASNMDKFGSQLFTRKNIPPREQALREVKSKVKRSSIKKQKVNKSGRKRIGRRGSRVKVKGSSEQIY